MTDRDFCDRAAALAAAAVGERFPHLARGAVAYPAFGPGVVLFFANDAPVGAPGSHPAVARLRQFLGVEEVGIAEIGFGTTPDGGTWVLLAQSRRDVAYCRRLIGKAFREAATPGTAPGAAAS